MKIIVPMAGRGSRLRPHTLTIPKPLVPIAGKSIVERLVSDIADVCQEKIEEVAFIIGDFGNEVKEDLMEIAKTIGAKGFVYEQEEALGTAHAILCAKERMEGKVIVAFADTLFRADFTLDESQDGIIWVQHVENPEAYGVVKLNGEGYISEFIEKPSEFVSNEAIIGIYYFKDGAGLRSELQYLIDNDIRENGEYQITNALENLKNKGAKLITGAVTEWLDCGNPKAAIYANQRMLAMGADKFSKKPASLVLKNAHVIEPCFFGENVVLENTTVGPHVSLGENSVVKNSVIKNSLIQNNTLIENAILENSMIGNHVCYKGNSTAVNIGDYCTFE